jgi:anti-anti-sigma factor
VDSRVSRSGAGQDDPPPGAASPLPPGPRPQTRIPSAERAQLEDITSALRASLPATVFTGVLWYDDTTLRPAVSSHSTAATLDRLQVALSQCPCRTALSEERPIVVATELDHRWPVLAHRARQMGVRGVLCLPLIRARRRLGVLTAYAQARPPFTPADTTIAGIFAARAARMLSTATSDSVPKEAVPAAAGPLRIAASHDHHDGPTTIAVSGEVDATTAVRLRAVVLRLTENLVIDLSGVTFFGVAGLAVLTDLNAHLHAHGSTLRLTAIPPQVLRLIRIARLEHTLL